MRNKNSRAIGHYELGWTRLSSAGTDPAGLAYLGLARSGSAEPGSSGIS